MMATRTTRTRRNAPALDAQPAVARSSAETEESLVALVGAIVDLDLAGLRLCWRNHVGGTSPTHLPKWLLARLLAYRVQAAALGDLDPATLRRIRCSSSGRDPDRVSALTPRVAATREGAELKPGAQRAHPSRAASGDRRSSNLGPGPAKAKRANAGATSAHDSGPRRLRAAEIESAIERVTLSASRVEIALADAADVEEQDRRLVLPWTRSSPHRRRDIIQGTDQSGGRPRRTMRARAREVFMEASIR
jgi:hypothetical protein